MPEFLRALSFATLSQPDRQQVKPMNEWTRRRLVTSLIAAPAALRMGSARAAEVFPARNIQFLIPYAPGGGFDVYVRVIAPVMVNYLPRKVNIVPVNVAGGGGS